MPAALTKNCFMTVLSSAFIIIFGKQLLHAAENLQYRSVVAKPVTYDLWITRIRI